MLKIKGIIGWDIIGTSFADMMQRLSGDVDIEIDSPGGYVTDGLSIFNAIKSYKKGKVNIKVVGQASSMAAYVMLAGDTLTFMPNAIVVLHNPWNTAIGDYRVMKKNGELLEKLAALYAEQFVDKGIFTEKEIRSIMDDETWFVGKKELAKLGDVESGDDDDNDSGDDDLSNDRDIVIQAAKERINQCKAKMSERETDMQALDRIAAMIGNKNSFAKMAPAASMSMSSAGQNLTNVYTNNKKGEEEMKNGEELKAQFPNVYAEVFAAGKKAGEATEKERVNALMGFIDTDKETIVKAVQEGGSIKDETIQAKLLQARLSSSAIQSMEQSNPGDIDPQQTDDGQEGSDDQDAAAKAAKEKAEADAKAEKEHIDKILAYMGIDSKS